MTVTVRSDQVKFPGGTGNGALTLRDADCYDYRNLMHKILDLICPEKGLARLGG
jgi:hypothetical protein